MTATLSKPRLNPALALGLSLVAFAVGPAFIRLAMDSGLPPLIIVVIRMSLSALFWTPVVFRGHQSTLRHLDKRIIFPTILAGIMLGSHFVLMMVSLDNTSIMVNQVIINTSPIWVGLMEVVFLGIILTRMVWLGLIVTIVGGAIIAFGSGEATAAANPTYGNIIALGAAIVYAIYLVLGRAIRPKVDFVPYIWLLYFSGAIAALVVAFITATPVIGYEPIAYFWALLVTLSSQIIGHGMINYAIGYLPATLVSLSGQGIIIGTTIVAFIVFREIPSPTDFLGSGVIVLGVILAIIGRQRKRSTA